MRSDAYETDWEPLPVTAAADVPRDGHGRWCKGAGCAEDSAAIVLTDDISAFGKALPDTRLSAPDDWFASPEEFAAAQALAHQKARTVPKPTKERIAKNHEIAARAAAGHGRPGGELRGSSYARRDRGEALFDEFGGRKKGYCPCAHCGIKVSPGGRGGFAHMEQDKILTLTEGGTYGTAKGGFPNLIPSCGGCNRSRGDTKYPVRPEWEGAAARKAAASKRSRGLAAAAGAFSTLIGQVVIGYPIGWNEPDTDGEGPDRPVRGILDVRTVDAFWGSYEQWIVGGEVVDPMTVEADDAR